MDIQEEIEEAILDIKSGNAQRLALPRLRQVRDLLEKRMSVYWLNRRGSHASHDQYNGAVVLAASEQDAREAARAYADEQQGAGIFFEPAEFLDDTEFECTLIGLDSDPLVILADWNEG